jgi:hypothetical protein
LVPCNVDGCFSDSVCVKLRYVKENDINTYASSDV